MKTVAAFLMMFVSAGIVNLLVVTQIKGTTPLSVTDVLLILIATIIAVGIIRISLKIGLEPDKTED